MKNEPSEDFKNCRHGDVVEGRGFFSETYKAIEWDVSSIKIIEPRLAPKDQVKWFDQGEWRYGEVLAVQRDNTKTWVWLQECGKWPRLTRDAKELTRVHPLSAGGESVGDLKVGLETPGR